MPGFLEHHPGLLFVAATLVPLLAFVLILLTFGVKTFFRNSPEGSAGEKVFQLLGGPAPGPAAAYVATGAIGPSCLPSLTGFVLYLQGHAAHESEALRIEEQIWGKGGKSHPGLRDQRHHKREDIEKLQKEITELRGPSAAAKEPDK